jgi:hypothetical protein
MSKPLLFLCSLCFLCVRPFLFRIQPSPHSLRGAEFHASGSVSRARRSVSSSSRARMATIRG